MNSSITRVVPVLNGRILFALLVLLLPSGSFAVTATWDAVVDPELQGYRLYIASGACIYPGEFFPLVTYGVVTSGDVPEPQVSGTYCYRLTAYNAGGESPPSNLAELVHTVSPPQCPSVEYCMTLKRKARKQCLACQ